MVEDGQTAKIHYKGSLQDGSVFDSSEGKNPLAFEIGRGQVLPGVEKAVKDMEVGETKTVEVEAADAYGEAREDMIATIPRGQFPPEIDPKPGMTLQMRTEEGTLPIEVVEVSDEDVKVNANHPLAGQDLTFELTLVDVS